MSREVVHEGTRSLWTGTYRTLCGLTFRQSRPAGWLSSVTCPGCKQVLAARKAGRSTR